MTIYLDSTICSACGNALPLESHARGKHLERESYSAPRRHARRLSVRHLDDAANARLHKRFAYASLWLEVARHYRAEAANLLPR